MSTKTLAWHSESRPITDLLPASYNPRTMSESERRDLAASVTEFGTVVPIIINTNNTVIGGHQRLKIYADLGINEVDVMLPNRKLTDTEEKQLNLRLNKNVGSWDMELLKAFDMDMLLDVGFGDDELQSLFDDVDVIEDNFDVTKALKETTIPKVKVGEIWELGEHRLLVGDSTNKELVQKLMQNDQADVVYCDPPYNIGLDYNKGISTYGKYEGAYTSSKDKKKDTVYGLFIQNSLETALTVSKKNAHVFYWCDEKYIWLLQTLYAQLGISNKRVCLWVKNNFNMTPQVAFNKAYEPCVYGVRGKPYLNEYLTNTNELLNKETGTGNQVHDEINDIFNLWLVKRDEAREYKHPTQKPVALNEKPLKRCSAPGHIVFSGFAGSGSDLIACEQVKRVWRGVELDPIFATIVIDRWEAFTNKKATRYEN